MHILQVYMIITSAYNNAVTGSSHCIGQCLKSIVFIDGPLSSYTANYCVGINNDNSQAAASSGKRDPKATPRGSHVHVHLKVAKKESKDIYTL